MGKRSKMNGWENDKKWSDKYLPEIKRNIGEFLICEPKDFEEDQKRNTDLTVLELRAIRVACRIRKDTYRERYSNEFTIRSDRPSGMETELTKIIKGWGEYFFYGFANEEHLTQWFIGDLNAFRLWFNRELVRCKGILPGKPFENTDNSSSFRVFEKDKIPDFIIASSTNIRRS